MDVYWYIQLVPSNAATTEVVCWKFVALRVMYGQKIQLCADPEYIMSVVIGTR